MEHKRLARYPLGNPRRVWRQDDFTMCIVGSMPIGLKYRDACSKSKTERAVKTCLDIGFDLLDTCWASPEMCKTVLETADRLGGKVLYQDLTRFGGMGEKNVFCERNDLLGAMRDTAHWRPIIGYFMWDEPTTDEQLAITAQMITDCEKERPGMLPFTVALPSYHPRTHWEDGAYAPYIDRFINIIDPAQMSFDYYPIGLTPYDEKIQLDESLFWCDLETVRRAAQKKGIPFWFCYQGHKFHFYRYNVDFTYPMVRMMANAGILHGVVQLTCYTEFQGMVDPETGGPGVYFEEHKKDLAKIHALGNTLMALTCERVIHDDSLLPDSPYMKDLRATMRDSVLLTGNLPHRISVSEHSDAYGNRYLMVLNRNYAADTSFMLKLKNASNVYRVSDEDGKQRLVFEDSETLVGYLPAGGLALYRIQPADEEAYTVEYYLCKETN